MIEFRLSELKNIEHISGDSAKIPGIRVIPKHKLAKLIRDKIDEPFNVKLLNQCLMLYCRTGYAVKMLAGGRKYNLIAERVPDFLQWLTDNWDKEFYDKISDLYQQSSVNMHLRIKNKQISR